jgi:palmitoyltransferase
MNIKFPYFPYYYYLTILPLYTDIFIIFITFKLFYINNSLNPNILNSPKIKFFLIPIFYFNTIMIIISHILCTITSSAVIHNNNKIQNKEIEKLINDEICKKCNCIKNIRTHHCSECKVCIIKMDHHCPWIVNCVGEKNKKSYVLFIFYGGINSLINSIVMFKEFHYVAKNSYEINQKEIININCILSQIKISGYYTLPFFGFFCSLFSFIFCFGLLINQIKGIYYNMTIVELYKYKNKEKCPLYNNNCKQNFKEIFNNNYLIWLIITVN